ncbi:MAG TPA: DNA mismatch repair protein MutS [Herpetosiphonaceae bacterium]
MTTSNEQLTPMMRQYRQIKAQYPDTILFWRLGDFYETFEDDAKLLAATLDVTLTRRSNATKSGDGVPMAGVPYHAVENYVQRLLQLGYRVAIAEQTSPTEAMQTDTRAKSVYQRSDLMRDRASQKGMVDREVVRVLTPGTLFEPALMDARSNNYLVAVIMERGRVGLAYTDISTGELAATELEGAKALLRLEGEITRLHPAEILVSDDERCRPEMLQPKNARLAQDLQPMHRDERERLLPHERVARKVDGQQATGEWVQGRVTPWAAWHWDMQTTRDALKQQFGSASLQGFGLSDKPLATRAAGAMLQYLSETQRTAAAQLTGVRCYSVEDFMFLDPQTRRNLELLESATGRKHGSLIDVLDQTRTPMGARLLRRWISQPLLDIARLQQRQQAVKRFVDDALLRAEVRARLKNIGDMERTINRVVQGVALPRDLVRLREALQALPELLTLLGSAQIKPIETGIAEAAPDNTFAIDDELFDDGIDQAEPQPASTKHVLDTCGDICKLLERSVADNPPALLGGWNPKDAENVIRRGFDPAIEELLQRSSEARQWMNDLERREIERTGIKSLKVGYNKNFNWYIEISKAVPESQIPPEYIRKQTLVGAERYRTAELDEYETILLLAEQKLNELERDAFKRVLQMAAQQAPRLLTTARGLAELDVYAALADVAVRGRYTCPMLAEEPILRIEGGRHPVVEQTLDQPFVANDVEMDAASTQILVITGPNMSGKSTYLRQVALIVLLAQIGAWVPADVAEIGLVDRIFTRIGAQDDIATGQSTFMVEMTETASILAQSTRSSLIVLDEIGRGTSTYDGLAIARSVVEYIHNNPRLGGRTLFATHYHELTELAQVLPRVRNYSVQVTEADGHVVFLHKIVPGAADRSYGVHVAELAGIPKAVVQRAKQLLAELEGTNKAERQRIRGIMQQGTEADPQIQLSLFAASVEHPVVEALRDLHVEELTPIEALTLLYDLQRQARLAANPQPTD